jgi:hypothetical protein
VLASAGAENQNVHPHPSQPTDAGSTPAHPSSLFQRIEQV